MKKLLITLLFTCASLHAIQRVPRLERFDYAKHSKETSALFKTVFPCSSTPLPLIYPDVPYDNLDVLVDSTHKVFGLVLHERSVSSAIKDLHAQTYLLEKGTAQSTKIKYLAVHPDYRKKGLGEIIMQGIERQEASHATDYLSLEPVPDAAPFYSRLGYAVTHSIGTWPRYMGKSLTEKGATIIQAILKIKH
jgi:GNAT superfamily N-acetyltransferase